jgi:hypothetical protein
MQLRDLLLPLLAALWALCTIVLNGTKEPNSIRDRIMFPDSNGFRTTLQHRIVLARNDWLPLLILLIVACVMFGLVSGLSPMLLDKLVWPALVLAICVASLAGAMAVVLLFSGYSDWRLICECLKEQDDQPGDETKKSGTPSACRSDPM